MSDKPLYYYSQSGVLPYKVTNGNIEVLLISTRKRKKWIIPKGIIELDLSARESAEKEAWEEAGVTGKIYESAMGNYEYPKWGGICKVEVYPMMVGEVLEEWPEDFRDRAWYSLDEAATKVKDKGLKKLIEEVDNLLNGDS